MFTTSASQFRCSKRSTHRRRWTATLVEPLEGRIFFAFNAYISGPASAVEGELVSFTLSTTGQAAKSWLVHWDDLSPDTPLSTSDPNGFTTPQTVQHQFFDQFHHTVTADATSITNVPATAVPLALNSAFTGGGTNGGNGKEVSGLGDNASAGTSIASVVDDVNNTYVLSIDGKRFAVTRFKPDGTLDSGANGWTTNGTFVLPPFGNVNTQDIPTAMAIDNANHLLYVAGGTNNNNNWAVARLNYNQTVSFRMEWQHTLLTGQATALRVDSSDDGLILGVAGTNSSAQIEVAKLFAIDQFVNLEFHAGGTLDTRFNGTGHTAVPNTVYGVPAPYTVTASAAAIVEGDDADVGVGGEEEWFVSGTVSYCCVSCNPAGGSDMVIVDFVGEGANEGTLDTTFGNGNGAALYNARTAYCVVGAHYDSNYAMVGSTVGGTPFLTIAGDSDGTVTTERFTANGQPDTAGYGVENPQLHTRPGFAFGPAGHAYAAVVEPDTDTLHAQQVVLSGASNSGADFMALRLNNDGTLDTSFGQGGVITVDFGSTSGVTSDGGRSVALRTVNGAVDILVAGYTFESSTGKYRIALVDLLDQNKIDIVAP